MSFLSGVSWGFIACRHSECRFCRSSKSSSSPGIRPSTHTDKSRGKCVCLWVQWNTLSILNLSINIYPSPLQVAACPPKEHNKADVLHPVKTSQLSDVIIISTSVPTFYFCVLITFNYSCSLLRQSPSLLMLSVLSVTHWLMTHQNQNPPNSKLRIWCRYEKHIAHRSPPLACRGFFACHSSESDETIQDLKIRFY